MMKPAITALAAGLIFGLVTAVLADDLTADQRFTETSVSFDLKGPHSNITLSVSGPNDFHASAFSKTGSPSLDLRQFGALDDGIYTYQLTAATGEKVKSRTPLDNGRPARTTEQLKGAATSGTFHVKNGAIVKRDMTVRSGRRDQ